MSAIDPEASLAELGCVGPTSAGILVQLGLDLRRDGDKPWREVCRAQGLEPRTVIRMLAALEQTRSPYPGGMSELMTLSELCDDIEESDHVSLLCELKQIDRLIRLAAADGGRSKARSAAIRNSFTTFRRNLRVHMREEREVLFPLIRRLEAGSWQARGEPWSLRASATLMQSQHNDADEALAELHELTAEAAETAPGPTAVHTLYEAIIRLENIVHEQIYKENQILFPRALSLIA